MRCLLTQARFSALAARSETVTEVDLAEIAIRVGRLLRPAAPETIYDVTVVGLPEKHVGGKLQLTSSWIAVAPSD